MFDRHLIGDIAIAILLAVPTVALSRPQADIPQHSSRAIAMAAQADPSSTEPRSALDS